MKKICIFFTMVLCYTLGMAQNLDQNKLSSDWARAVTYCCAQYEVQYFKFLDPEQKNSFTENILKDLSLVKLDATNLGMQYINGRLKERKCLEDAGVKYIYTYFDSISTLPINERKFDVLFPIIKLDKLSFETFAGELRSVVRDAYTQAPNTSKSTESSLNWDVSLVEIVLMVLALSLLIIVIVLIVKISSIQSDVDCLRNSLKSAKTDIDIHMLKHNKGNISGATSVKSKDKGLDALSLRVSYVESAMKQLSSRLDANTKKEVKSATNTEPSSSRSEISTKEAPSIAPNEPTSPAKSGVSIYLKNFNAGTMKECPASDTQYELILPDAQSLSGEFTFVGDINSALATKDATFEDVCDLEKWSMSSKSCDTVEKGKAEKVSDGKWKVIKKAKVKFS